MHLLDLKQKRPYSFDCSITKTERVVSNDYNTKNKQTCTGVIYSTYIPKKLQPRFLTGVVALGISSLSSLNDTMVAV